MWGTDPYTPTSLERWSRTLPLKSQRSFIIRLSSMLDVLPLRSPRAFRGPIYSLTSFLHL